MKYYDNILKTYTIENQFDTVSDVKMIVEMFYDLGTVIEVKQITVGDTNYSYKFLIKKNNIERKYFAQLFNPDKSLADVKYELALRKYFMKNRRGVLKCATHFETKEGGYAVICHCPQIERERYFCLFTFLDGNMIGDRDVWAFGRMSNRLIDGITAGLAEFHVGACGFEIPKECGIVPEEYSEELLKYRNLFVEGYEKKINNENLKEYFVFFNDFKPKLIAFMDKYSASYMAAKNQLPKCISHMDPSINNYLFNEEQKPISVCDLDFSKEHLRLFDLCWLFLEAFYNPNDVDNCMDVDKCAYMLDAYDFAIEKLGSEKLKKLSTKEREMFPEIFQLVAIGFGFSNVWDIMITGGPACSNEYNIYWGTWGKNAMEYMENHMEEFKKKLIK